MFGGNQMRNERFYWPGGGNKGSEAEGYDGRSKVCYTSVIDEGFGFQRVVTGCMSKQVCRNNGIMVRRQTGTEKCFDCCDTDLCNGKLCQTAPPSGFRECYGCESVSSPSNCDTSKLCTDDQYCMTEYRYTGAQSGTYRMDCESIAMCEKQEQYAGYFNKRDLGKKSSSSFDHHSSTNQFSSEKSLSANDQQALNISERYIDDPMVICLSCCKYPFCNNHENCVTKDRLLMMVTDMLIGINMTVTMSNQSIG
ncbi:hypothetical protein PoB_007203900 [Plakobranchus ocellatus]|uniref:Uncharacterized protein n=1 Tax=Plakobranchus ocellatus TaxID=259542 RepID=A0AAV4DMW8_9GAST|nr:hypothetical protein PoB_007203900 [Plakobranchus ocellatus]